MGSTARNEAPKSEEQAITLVLGRLIGQLREHHGMTQGELAARISVAQSTMSRMERGEVRPDYIELRRLAAVYEMTPEDLMAMAERAINETRESVKQNTKGSAGGEWWAAVGIAALLALAGYVLIRLLADKGGPVPPGPPS